VLHVTNGDCAVAVLSQAVSGEILPWRDVLHEGPVHCGIPLPDFSRRRAQFIASAGWASLPEVEKQFAQRDSILATAAKHGEVVLWFEHDLYDQLQLIQLLDWFGAHPHPRLTLVCEAEYLANMTTGRAADLFKERSPVTREQIDEAQKAWAAFGGSDPRRVRVEPVAALPFLGPALYRLLEEFPWSIDGLSRLERQVLDTLAGGPLEFRELFPRAHHHREDPVFLGDTVLAWHLQRMEAQGLLRRDGEKWISTNQPRRLRQPRWIGGYEIRDETYCWDPALARLVRRG
jgi:hypothetical protein